MHCTALSRPSPTTLLSHRDAVSRSSGRKSPAQTRASRAHARHAIPCGCRVNIHTLSCRKCCTHVALAGVSFGMLPSRSITRASRRPQSRQSQPRLVDLVHCNRQTDRAALKVGCDQTQRRVIRSTAIVGRSPLCSARKRGNCRGKPNTSSRRSHLIPERAG
jgi:hypothetical protein